MGKTSNNLVINDKSGVKDGSPFKNKRISQSVFEFDQVAAEVDTRNMTLGVTDISKGMMKTSSNNHDFITNPSPI